MNTEPLTPPPGMMEPHHLARIAYFALLQRVADAQAKIIEIEALIARFGDDALPSESALRSIGALSRASDSMRTRLRSNQDRIEEALPTIRFLERVFAEQSERDLEALATYFRSQR